MSLALVDGNKKASYPLKTTRKCWVHVAKGSVDMNGHSLRAGDGAAIEHEEVLHFSDGHDAEVIVFDMAMTT